MKTRLFENNVLFEVVFSSQNHFQIEILLARMEMNTCHFAHKTYSFLFLLENQHNVKILRTFAPSKKILPCTKQGKQKMSLFQKNVKYWGINNVMLVIQQGRENFLSALGS